jgi:predicted TIM-barrel fold metal-dependent hydrolase
MDANGVLGSLCFPSMTGFCGQLFARVEDKDFARALVQGYNDWHIDEWCGTYPGRFIPLSIPALWSPDEMAAEVRRVAKKGCHAVTFSENPEKLGYPSLHSEHWDPFWTACSDENTIVCLHIGSSSQMVVTAADAPINVMITLQPINLVQAASDLLWSRVLKNFPDLKFAMSEGGIGWIPYFLERVDYVYRHHKEWTGAHLGGKLPSELFNERIITCFIDDAVGLETRHHLNLDHITWECDYPHSDSTWPHSPELLAPALAGLSDAEINKITHENAIKLFSYDPFAHIPKEQCTVGALRAQATDVDVSEKAVTGAQPRDPSEPPITIMSIVEMATGKK